MGRNLIFILVLFTLNSCTTQRKAFSWMDKNPSKAAEYSISRFPIKSDTIRLPAKTFTFSDTTYIPGDTIPCPVPTVAVPTPEVACPPSKIIRDTIKSVESVVITKENPAKDKIIEDLNNQLYGLRKQSKTRLKILIYLAVALVGSVYFNVQKLM